VALESSAVVPGSWAHALQLVARPTRPEALRPRRAPALVSRPVDSRFRSLVLCYHAVSDDWPDELAVLPSLFERQLRSLLGRGYRSVSAGDVLGGHRGVFHVTFDDAFRSVANALPIMERLNVSATVFACSDYAEDGRPLDVPELAAQAQAHPGEMATMTWDELRGLAERGVEIGSHTLTHPHLPRLSDAELGRELSESRERVEGELGRSCAFLAYPFGEQDARVRAAAHRAGYRAAFALRSRPRPIDLFAVPRVDLYRKDRPLRARLKTSLLPRAPEFLLEFTRTRAAKGVRRG
jgi:peptidoglycan/xylan/chitin deacetylase (PgdA/CDA1 family)